MGAREAYSAVVQGQVALKAAQEMGECYDALLAIVKAAKKDGRLNGLEMPVKFWKKVNEILAEDTDGE